MGKRVAARLEDQVAERISAKLRAITARSGLDLPASATREQIAAQLRATGEKSAELRRVLDGAKATGNRAVPDRLLRLREVVKLTGLSPSTLRRQERAGGFPRRREVSKNGVAWSEREVLAWMASRRRRGSDGHRV